MSKKPYFESLIFDLDGTLINSKKLMVDAIIYSLRNKKIKIPSRTKILKELSNSPKKLLRSYGVHDASDYWNYYTDYLSQIKPVNKRLNSYLSELKDNGISLGIVTSLPKKVTQKLLDNLNISDYFDVVVTYGDTKKHKPSPDPVLKVLKKLKVDKENAIYIGDLPEDIIAGREAQISTGAVLWSGLVSKDVLKREQPSYFFRHFKEIIGLANREKEFNINGFIPNKISLKNKNRKRKKSCLTCNETADCLNCSRLYNINHARKKWWFWSSLKTEYLKEVKSSEYYIPRHASDEASMLLYRFKQGKENFKYRFRLGASMVLNLIELQKNSEIFRDIDMIIPVPSTKTKVKEREYNPPEILAKVIGYMLDIPVEDKILKTVIRKGRKESRYNEDFDKFIERIVQNSSVSKKHFIRGKKILLIDDVLTDGATILGYSKALYKSVKDKPCIIGYTFACTYKKR